MAKAKAPVGKVPATWMEVGDRLVCLRLAVHLMEAGALANRLRRPSIIRFRGLTIAFTLRLRKIVKVAGAGCLRAVS